MIYFDCLIELLPNLDMNVSILGFILIICTIIVRETHDPELEDIKALIRKILEDLDQGDF